MPVRLWAERLMSVETLEEFVGPNSVLAISALLNEEGYSLRMAPVPSYLHGRIIFDAGRWAVLAPEESDGRRLADWELKVTGHLSRLAESLDLVILNLDHRDRPAS